MRAIQDSALTKFKNQTEKHLCTNQQTINKYEYDIQQLKTAIELQTPDLRQILTEYDRKKKTYFL